MHWCIAAPFAAGAEVAGGRRALHFWAALHNIWGEKIKTARGTEHAHREPCARRLRSWPGWCREATVMGARPRRCHGSFFFGQDLARLFLARLFLAAYRKKIIIKTLELIDLWAARGGKRGSAASGTGRTALAWPIPASSADAAAGSAGNWARSSSVASCPSINRGGQRGGGSGSGAGTSWLPAGGCSRSSVRPQSPHVEPLLFAGPFPAGFLPSPPYGDGTELPLCRGAAPSEQLAVTLLLFGGHGPISVTVCRGNGRRRGGEGGPLPVGEAFGLSSPPEVVGKETGAALISWTPLPR